MSLEEPELIGVVKGLQEVGNDACRGRTTGSLRSESGLATDSNGGSGAGPKIDQVLDMDMVLEAVEVKWQGDILLLEARARRPCYGQPFY